MSEQLNDIKGFLVELSALSRKYKLIVDGCGCCGSPFITKLKDPRTLEGKYVQIEGGKDIVWYPTPWDLEVLDRCQPM